MSEVQWVVLERRLLRLEGERGDIDQLLEETWAGQGVREIRDRAPNYDVEATVHP